MTALERQTKVFRQLWQDYRSAVHRYHHQSPSETGDMDDEHGGFFPPEEVLESDRKEMVAAGNRVRMVLDSIRAITQRPRKRKD